MGGLAVSQHHANALETDQDVRNNGRHGLSSVAAPFNALETDQVARHDGVQGVFCKRGFHLPPKTVLGPVHHKSEHPTPCLAKWRQIWI